MLDDGYRVNEIDQRVDAITTCVLQLELTGNILSDNLITRGIKV